MKFFLLLFLVLGLFLSEIFGQFSAIQWQKALGGSGDDQGFAIAKSADSGFVVAGYSASSDDDISSNNGGQDFWIVKIDGSGGFQWEGSYGGSNYDVARGIFTTSGGGSVVAGYSWSTNGFINAGENHGLDDYWIIRLDDGGGLLWQTMAGGSGNDEASSVIQTSDGGYLVAGNSNSLDGDVSGNRGGFDYWIVKLDSNGNKKWKKCFGGSGDDFATSVIQTHDGNYVIAGYASSADSDVTNNHGYNDYWIIKIDTGGAMLWEKTYGGSNDDRAYSIIETTSYDLVVAGWSNSADGDITNSHGNGDYWIVKLDSSGNMKWQRSIGGSNYEEANSVIETFDGKYAISGKSFSTDGDVGLNKGSSDYWIVLLDTAGGIVGKQVLGGSDIEKTPAIAQANDGGFVVAGTSASNDQDVSGNHGGFDYWAVKITTLESVSEISRQKSFQIFPNPSDGDFKISPSLSGLLDLEIVDALGSSLKTLHLNPSPENCEVHTDFPNGVYFVKIRTSEGWLVQKLVIAR